MFRLFGFDVRVQSGFVIFLVLIAFLYPAPLSYWIAGGLAVFTLIHELGHALAARSAGADASIALSFMAGYTSFRPNPMRPISRARRALISAAGPLIQIATGTAVLFALGASPIELPSASMSDAAIAVWWAGPVIGVLNLIPVLPLDGGHLLQTAIEPIFKGRTLRVMAIFSIVVTVGAAVAMAVTGNGGFGLFIAFLVIGQAQILSATSTKRRQMSTAGQPGQGGPQARAVEAEASAWQSGRPGILEPGQVLSPWFRAYQAVQHGESSQAVQPILKDLTAANSGNWAPPAAATPQQLQRVTALLPDPIPPGNARGERVMGQVLLQTGETARAGEYAVGTFERHGGSIAALTVARAAARMGDTDIAAQWIETAATAAQSEPTSERADLVRAVQHLPELASVRARPNIHRVLAQLGAQASG